MRRLNILRSSLISMIRRLKISVSLKSKENLTQLHPRREVRKRRAMKRKLQLLRKLMKLARLKMISQKTRKTLTQTHI